MNIEYRDTKVFTAEELQRLFRSVNWESLFRAASLCKSYAV